ncbi:hypothetical protein HN695_04710 [Candidatus Woesearchaeota archaeon]|jgi:hypothetical protein|nr:hypothetical protein [Candidatus Woesearchaeota archaeon]MBT5271878.1 hypothetical protein [Candidatus Woesearchaeota archaeon]MBT6041658.1 hypothetical protein [Candidatus Woesearchaeota archaeon]MBT6337366.1 hypothetical protein [Candidatus Woesearchaeota archaeon]MBT7927614.1 hypothetical protein [Candidatus Woesearchaeota archaeon]
MSKKALSLPQTAIVVFIVLLVFLGLSLVFQGKGYAFVQKNILGAEKCITPLDCSTSLNPGAGEDNDGNGVYDGQITTKEGVVDCGAANTCIMGNAP